MPRDTCLPLFQRAIARQIVKLEFLYYQDTVAKDIDTSLAEILAEN